MLSWGKNKKVETINRGVEMAENPRPVIPPILKGEPWPPDQDRYPQPQKAEPYRHKTYEPDLQDLQKKLDEQAHEPVELGDPLDTISGDVVKLTFGEMVQWATELTQSQGNDKLPDPMTLATILHNWGVLKAKKHKFEAKESSQPDTNSNPDNGNKGQKPKNGRTPRQGSADPGGSDPASTDSQ